MKSYPAAMRTWNVREGNDLACDPEVATPLPVVTWWKSGRDGAMDNDWLGDLAGNPICPGDHTVQFALVGDQFRVADGEPGGPDPTQGYGKVVN